MMNHRKIDENYLEKPKLMNRAFNIIKSILNGIIISGIIIACFYIKGKSRISDWLVNTILSKKGWFTPPFHTEEELIKILKHMYKDIDMNFDGSMVYFCCTK